jgi:hypothetical protein
MKQLTPCPRAPYYSYRQTIKAVPVPRKNWFWHVTIGLVCFNWFLFPLSLFSLYLCTYLSICLSTRLQIRPSVHLSVCICLSISALFMSPSLYLCLSLSLSVCVCFSVWLCVCLPLSLSSVMCVCERESVCVCVCLADHLCVHCMSVCLPLCFCLSALLSAWMESHIWLQTL